MDPLLKDLIEKKQSFRRTVVSLAAELKDVRSKLVSQQHSFSQETQARQEIEMKARIMEEEILQLRGRLEDANAQLQASAVAQYQYLKELEDLKSQLSATQATADSNAAFAQSAHLQCVELLKELDNNNSPIEEHEDHVDWLGLQVAFLQKELQAREASKKQMMSEVYTIEQDITQAAVKATARKNFDLGKILQQASPDSLEKINKHLAAKDEKIAKLREEMRNMSAHWKLKTKDLELQIDRYHRTDQELRKKVTQLEFCLQEARSQIRKLQRIGEKKDKALKELKEKFLAKRGRRFSCIDVKTFFESSGFKILISMSMLILVVSSKCWRNQSSNGVA